mgnify:CR=1 FL=1
MKRVQNWREYLEQDNSHWKEKMVKKKKLKDEDEYKKDKKKKRKHS